MEFPLDEEDDDQMEKIPTNQYMEQIYKNLARMQGVESIKEDPLIEQV